MFLVFSYTGAYSLCRWFLLFSIFVIFFSDLGTRENSWPLIANKKVRTPDLLIRYYFPSFSPGTCKPFHCYWHYISPARSHLFITVFLFSSSFLYLFLYLLFKCINFCDVILPLFTIALFLSFSISRDSFSLVLNYICSFFSQSLTFTASQHSLSLLKKMKKKILKIQELS